MSPLGRLKTDQRMGPVPPCIFGIDPQLPVRRVATIPVLRGIRDALRCRVSRRTQPRERIRGGARRREQAPVRTVKTCKTVEGGRHAPTTIPSSGTHAIWSVCGSPHLLNNLPPQHLGRDGRLDQPREPSSPTLRQRLQLSRNTLLGGPPLCLHTLVLFPHTRHLFL